MDSSIFVLEGSKYLRLDLFRDEGLVINSVIQDVRDISKVFTEFTKTFTVPASKNNNKIFKHYNNFHIIDGFDARIKKDSKIEVNGSLFKKGTIRLDNVDIKNNKVYAYKITFFGNTVNIKDVFGEDKLSDISTSFFSNFDREYTSLRVREALQDAIDVTIDSTTYNDALLTPLITHTTRLFYDSGTNYGAYYIDNKVNELGGNLLAHGGTGQSHHHGVHYGELKYALRLHIILIAIQQHYGITFSDDFFNTSNSIYYDLYMWLHRKEGNVFEDNETITTALNNFTVGVYSNLQCSLVVKSTDQATIIVDDNTTSTDTRRVNITIQTNTTTNPDYTVVLTKNGSVLQNFNVDDSSSTQTSVNTYFETVDVFSDDEYQVLIKSKSTVSFNASGLTFVKFNMTKLDGSSSTDTTIDLASVITTSSDQNFIIQEQIPEMKVIDFITSLFKMFNLTAFAEDDGTIKVQTLDSFYESSDKVWDFTDKVEIDYNVKPALPFKEIDFSYGGLKTYLAHDHQKRFNLGWGSTEYDSNENESGQRYDFNTKIYKVQPQFEHMKFERIIDVDTDGVKRSQVGWFVNEQKNAYVDKPLLFYPHRVSGSTLSSEYAIRFLNDLTHINSNSSSDIATYYIPSNSQSLSASTSKNNIHFNQESNEYSFADNVPFTDTLFKRFYRIYIQKIFHKQTRLSSFKCNFPIDFIVNHTLADRVSIRGSKYIINNLKINLKTGLGSMDLINDVKVTNKIKISDSSYTTAASACSVVNELIELLESRSTSTENKVATATILQQFKNCEPHTNPSTNLNTEVYYDINSLLADSVALFTDESLSVPFAGDGNFYKLSTNQSARINYLGVVSNLTDC